MTPKLSTTVQERIEAAAASDAEHRLALDRFYAATARLEALDRELFADLDRAWVDALAAARRVAWVDGWKCGRNPDNLVFDAGEGGA